MKQRTWMKTVGMAFLGLGLLAGCSGSGDNGQEVSNLVEEAPINVDQKVAEWGKFVGISTEEAKLALSGGAGTVNLLARVGKTSQLNQAELDALLNVTKEHDSIFADSVSLLNEINQKVFFGIRVLTAPIKKIIVEELEPTADKLEAIRADYSKMVAQATLVRSRLVQGAAILGFTLEPNSMRDVVADPAFRTIRDAFAANLIDELFGKSIEAASQEEIIFISEAIASVSFRIDGQFLSFYEFSPRIKKIEGEVIREFDRELVPLVTTRGQLRILPAIDNLYIIELRRAPVEEVEIIEIGD